MDFSLSFYSFSYNGVCFDGLKLSVNDVLDTMEQCVRDKKLISALKNFAKMNAPFDIDWACD